ncbi:GerMN domain-containing protein [Lusitaniella coriacea LEGE 07157]|uniref:GerMN domain-containing protein n=2 Tax=Lusitaniella TaxID=1983104 RepID=A0A8J7DSY6_9CYAN|nr:GerMN domain-containing protein [Lusitaniella coriacea LEGE 07157]
MTAIIVGITTSIVVASCGTEDTNNTVQPLASPPETAETQQPSPEASVAPRSATLKQAANENTIPVYWLDANAQTVKVVSRPVNLENKDETQANAALEAAFTSLLSGPKNAENTDYATAIPKETRLLGVAQQADGVRINLSEQFTTGGGTTSMTGRVAQIIYTATALNPEAKVWIEVEGKPLEVLGGEGLIIDQPMTRKSFRENFDL